MIILIMLALAVFVVPHAGVLMMHRMGFWPAVAILSCLGAAVPLVVIVMP